MERRVFTQDQVDIGLAGLSHAVVPEHGEQEVFVIGWSGFKGGRRAESAFRIAYPV